MANRRSSGGLIGKNNKASGGGNTVTTFLSSGTFTAQKTTTAFETLTVAGGGGGGENLAGGGGAGGLRNSFGTVNTGGGLQTESKTVLQPGTSYAITVGGGGAGGSGGPPNADGAQGSSSSIGGVISAEGGGFGGSNYNRPGGPGGSGGGGGCSDSGGDSNAGPALAGQGYAGGSGYRLNSSGGGGGGAAAAGGSISAPPLPPSPSSPNQDGGDGGAGLLVNIDGNSYYYAGGGGGGGYSGYTDGGDGGLGGGGGGASGPGGPGADNSGQGRGGAGGRNAGEEGTITHPSNPGAGDGGAAGANTGSGGGGASHQPGPFGRGGAGGSGIVIVKELDRAQGVFDMKSQFTSHSQGQWPTRGGVDEISNSLMFNGGAEDVYLTRVPSSATDQINWTFSCWVKYTGPEAERPIFNAQATADLSSGAPQFALFWHTGGTLRIWTNSGAGSAYTARLFRDFGAWYHIVLESSNVSPYYRLYINGKENTTWSYDNRTTAPGGSNTYVNSANPHFLGAWRNGSIMSPGMYLADVHLVDGQSLHPGHFGEPDPDCPQIWRPKKYYGTYGTNGCHLEFKNSAVGTGSASTIGADTSGNGNHWTTSGLAVTDQTTDTPTNSFCTLNPLINSAQNGTLSEGNRKLVSTSSSWGHKLGTMAVTNGKWYYEAKVTTATGNHYIGWQDIQPTQSQIAANPQSDSSGTTIWYTNTYTGGSGHLRKNDTDDSAVSGSGGVNGTIVSVALDLDSSPQTITIYKDGVAVDSDNTIASGNTGTLVPFIGNVTSGASIEFNFGNPAFVVYTGHADANGYGNFEFPVPSGFYALCSKNLALYG